MEKYSNQEKKNLNYLGKTICQLLSHILSTKDEQGHTNFFFNLVITRNDLRLVITRKDLYKIMRVIVLRVLFKSLDGTYVKKLIKLVKKSLRRISKAD